MRTLFVVGAARSGTTWVRSILAEDRRVVTGPESHLFPVLYRPLLTSGDRDAWRDGVLAAFAERAAAAPERFGDTGPHRWVDRGTLERLLDEAAACREGGGSGDDAARAVIGGVLDAYAAANGGPDSTVLVEKTPRHVLFTRQILDWWPDARVVEVIRDGRDVCVSLDHKSRVRSWASADREQQVRQWVEAVRHGRAVAAEPAARGRWLTVRFEDLVADGPRQVRRLYEFAGLPCDDHRAREVVAATSIERLRRPGTEHHLRKGAVGEWRHELTAADLELFDRLAGAVLEELGYAPNSSA